MALAGCDRPPEIQTIDGYAQGTTYHISFWSDQPVAREQLQQGLARTLAQIDREISTYRADSFISKFNRSASTDWQAASTDFVRLLGIARDIYRKTGGCYDPTVGPLFDLWGFRGDVLHVPTAQQIAAAEDGMGMDKIEVDEAGERIRKTLPTVRLDLSSMGEGFTIGKLSEVLESQGIGNYLLEFGGDLKARGHKPDGQKWRIAIRRPVPAKSAPKPYQVVTIDDEQGVTLDTSGTYQHYLDKDGKAYPHILDPRTGGPVTHNLVSASVFGSDPPVSDAWATALLCLGPVEGPQVARRERIEAFFIEDKQGQLVDTKSEALTHSKRIKLGAKL